MSIRITLDLFSGQPNPQVVVDGDQANEILRRLRPESQLTRSEQLPAPESVLGYRGLIVEQLDRRARDLPATFRVANGQLIGEGLRHAASDEGIEDFLCSSTGPFRPLQLPEAAWADIRKQILAYWELRRKWPRRPPPERRRQRCECAPLYEPAWWNNDPNRLAHNNCYNYSTNYRTDTFAQPGRASGVTHNTTCPTTAPAAVADGLINAPAANNRCPREGHLVALVVYPAAKVFRDYHWYRKGRNQYWTHKPGSTPATNVDNSGNLISDPRTANRGPYTVFCTFMVVMHGHIKLR